MLLKKTVFVAQPFSNQVRNLIYQKTRISMITMISNVPSEMYIPPPLLLIIQLVKMKQMTGHM